MEIFLFTSHVDLRDHRTHDGKPLRNIDKHKLTKSDNAVQLAIYDVRKEDSGTYKLYAKTDAGDHSHKTFKLFVNDKTNGAGGANSPPEFLRRLQDISVKIGTHTRLLVELRSASDVKVNWFRNERRVIEDERITLVHEGTFYCVEISAVSMDDGGTWTCLAENGEGRNSTVANFNVLGECCCVDECEDLWARLLVLSVLKLKLQLDAIYYSIKLMLFKQQRILSTFNDCSLFSHQSPKHTKCRNSSKS